MVKKVWILMLIGRNNWKFGFRWFLEVKKKVCGKEKGLSEFRSDYIEFLVVFMGLGLRFIFL